MNSTLASTTSTTSLAETITMTSTSKTITTKLITKKPLDKYLERLANFNKILDNKIAQFNQSKTYTDTELNTDSINRVQIDNLVKVNYAIYLKSRDKQFIVSVFTKTAATACLTTLLLLCGVFYRMWRVVEETFQILKTEQIRVKLRRRHIRNRVLLPI